jgi:hypothetical protein
MNRYTRQFFSLLNTIYKKIRQQIFNQKPSQPASLPKESFSFLEAARRAEKQSTSEQSESKLIAQSTREESQHRNSGKKSKRAKWAEKRSKQKIAYAEAQANGDRESIRKYWKWIKRYGASTTEYYAREKARRKAAKKIAAKNKQNLSDEAKKRQAEIKADAQCEFPEDAMIEHLEDHRDGIGWSIAALAKKRFYVRRTLKINDSNGDMFCEVDDNGESLLKAVKQLISEHNHSNENK